MITAAMATIRQMIRIKATPPPATPPIKAMLMPVDADGSTLDVVSVSSKMFPPVTIAIELTDETSTRTLLDKSMLLRLSCVEVSILSILVLTGEKINGETSMVASGIALLCSISTAIVSDSSLEYIALVLIVGIAEELTIVGVDEIELSKNELLFSTSVVILIVEVAEELATVGVKEIELSKDELICSFIVVLIAEVVEELAIVNVDEIKDELPCSNPIVVLINGGEELAIVGVDKIKSSKDELLCLIFVVVLIVEVAEELTIVGVDEIKSSTDGLFCSTPIVVLIDAVAEEAAIMGVAEEAPIMGVADIKLTTDELLCSTFIIEFSTDVTLFIIIEFTGEVIGITVIIESTTDVLLITGASADAVTLSTIDVKLLPMLVLTGDITEDVADMRLFRTEVVSCIISLISHFHY